MAEDDIEITAWEKSDMLNNSVVGKQNMIIGTSSDLYSKDLTIHRFEALKPTLPRLNRTR